MSYFYAVEVRRVKDELPVPAPYATMISFRKDRSPKASAELKSDKVTLQAFVSLPFSLSPSNKPKHWVVFEGAVVTTFDCYRHIELRCKRLGSPSQDQ
jgi:hypothetical protein